MRKIIIAVVMVAAISALLFVSWRLTTGVVVPRETIVTKVIDGDTLIIEGGEHVRLLGIDADEKNYPCYTEAKLALENLVLNRRVILEPDKEDMDQYGRLLRWVWVDDTLVNFELVNDGLAVARFVNDVKYQDEIKAAESEAIDHRIGCKWSSLE